MTPNGLFEVLVGQLPTVALAFTLVLCRTGMVVMLVPGLGEAEPPAVVRAGLALGLSLLLLPSVVSRVPEGGQGWNSVRMIAAELLVGGALGWLARLPAFGLSMAGAIVSYMTGLTSVVQPDPALGGQSAALARLFSVMTPMLIFSSGLYALPLSALSGSFEIVPPGAMIPADQLVDTVQQALSASFGLAVRLSAPFLLAGVLLQAGLGLLARLVPQLQVFSASAPGQILGGLILLGLIAAPFLTAWSETVASSWSVLPGL